MQLASKVRKYIQHKKHLADHSTYFMNNTQLVALQFCDMLLSLLCRQKQYLTEQDVARFVLQNKQHLFNILPVENNKSYQSSLENYNWIIERSQELLKPKTR
jgi:hypothetical protein